MRAREITSQQNRRNLVVWVNKRGIMGIFGAGTGHASHRVALFSHTLSPLSFLNFLTALFFSARESTRIREIAEPRIRTPSPRYKANYWISRDGKQGTAGRVAGRDTGRRRRRLRRTANGGERRRRGGGRCCAGAYWRERRGVSVTNHLGAAAGS